MAVAKTAADETDNVEEHVGEAAPKDDISNTIRQLDANSTHDMHIFLEYIGLQALSSRLSQAKISTLTQFCQLSDSNIQALGITSIELRMFLQQSINQLKERELRIPDLNGEIVRLQPAKNLYYMRSSLAQTVRVRVAALKTDEDAGNAHDEAISVAKAILQRRETGTARDRSIQEWLRQVTAQAVENGPQSVGWNLPNLNAYSRQLRIINNSLEGNYCVTVSGMDEMEKSARARLKPPADVSLEVFNGYSLLELYRDQAGLDLQNQKGESDPRISNAAGFVLNCGGPVSALSALPEMVNGECIIAVGTLLPYIPEAASDIKSDHGQKFPWERGPDGNLTGHNIIQIWTCKDMRPHENRSEHDPVSFAFGIAHEKGDILGLQFCSVLSCPDAHTLTYLAVLAGGEVTVIAVPNPTQKRDGQIVDADAVCTIKVDDTVLTCCEWSPFHPTRILTGALDGSVYLWDLPCIADGGTGTASEKGPVLLQHFWDAVAASASCLLNGRASVTAIAWSPSDETLFASVGKDALVRIWDVNDAQMPIIEQRVGERLAGDSLNDVTWVIGGEDLVVSGDLNFVTLLEICNSGTQRALMNHAEHFESVWCCRLLQHYVSDLQSPAVASCGSEGRVRVLSLALRGAPFDASVFSHAICESPNSNGHSPTLEIKLALRLFPECRGEIVSDTPRSWYSHNMMPHQSKSVRSLAWTPFGGIVSGSTNGLVRIQHIELNVDGSISWLLESSFQYKSKSYAKGNIWVPGKPLVPTKTNKASVAKTGPQAKTRGRPRKYPSNETSSVKYQRYKKHKAASKEPAAKYEKDLPSGAAPTLPAQGNFIEDSISTAKAEKKDEESSATRKITKRGPKQQKSPRSEAMVTPSVPQMRTKTRSQRVLSTDKHRAGEEGNGARSV